MEPVYSFSPASHAKRKWDSNEGDGLLLADFLNGVSLSPRKRSRQDTILPTVFEACQNFVPQPDLHDNVHVPIQLDVDLCSQPLEPPPVPSPNDERAIVLYKHVNPPLFPGGPTAGSSIRLNANLIPKRTLFGSNSFSQLSFSQEGKKSSVVIEELQDIDDAGNDIIVDSAPDNRLAVIPWLPNIAGSSPNTLTLHQIAQSGGNQDEMVIETLDTEAMEEDVGNLEVDTDQIRNPTANLSSEPWQHYGVPQPQYGSIMWSH